MVMASGDTLRTFAVDESDGDVVTVSSLLFGAIVSNFTEQN